EADNSEFGFDLQPRCAPYFCNVTLVGPNDTPAGTFPSTGDGARLRRGTAGKIENSIIENWPSNTVDYRDPMPTCVELAGIRENNNGVPATHPNCAVGTGNACGGGNTGSNVTTGQCANIVSPGSSLVGVAGHLPYYADTANYCSAAGKFVDNRYMLKAAAI